MDNCYYAFVSLICLGGVVLWYRVNDNVNRINDEYCEL